jgi:dsRNA-specific ribonuclease
MSKMQLMVTKPFIQRLCHQFSSRNGARFAKVLGTSQQSAGWSGAICYLSNRPIGVESVHDIARLYRNAASSDQASSLCDQQRFYSSKGAPFIAVSNGVTKGDTEESLLVRYRRCMTFLDAWGIPPFVRDPVTKQETFRGWPLLLRALTHASALPPHLCPRRSGVLTNEQRWERYQLHNAALEFVGDRVLNLCVVDWLIRTQPWKSRLATTTVPQSMKTEEMLSSFLHRYIFNARLSEVACRIGLEPLVRRRLPYENSRMDRGRELVLANAFEALVCAIFLEHGFEHAERFITRTLLEDSGEADVDASTSAPILQPGDALDERARITCASPDLFASWRKPLSFHPKEALEKELLLWGLSIVDSPHAEPARPIDPPGGAERPGACVTYRLESEAQRYSHKSMYIVCLELSGSVVSRGYGRSIRSAENAAAAAFLGALGLDCSSFRVQHAHGETQSSQEIWKRFMELGVPLVFPETRSESDGSEEDTRWATALLWNRRRLWIAGGAKVNTARSGALQHEDVSVRYCRWLPRLFTDSPNLMESFRSMLLVVLPELPGTALVQNETIKHIALAEYRFLGHWCWKLYAATRSLWTYGPAAASSAVLHDHYVKSIATTAVSHRAAQLMRLLRDAQVWPREVVLAPQEQRDMLLSLLGVSQILYGYDAGPSAFLEQLRENDA